MSDKNNFYITTTLPYVNSDPHIGFAMEIVRADVMARFHSALGDEVFFNTGTDEHGIKIYRKAEEAGVDVTEYVDKYADKFKGLIEALNITPSINFIRTTDEDHIKAAQAFWNKCEENGDIYKQAYKTKYCVGCELEKTDSELEEGKCPIHPDKEIEVIEEENYFFKFSKYEKQLLDLYESNPNLVIPSWRLNEAREFVKRGLRDFSISRLKEKMPWGVPVPGDDEHVMYVWFDALVNYVSAIGWPEDMDKFQKWWPVTQYAGKDNLRQQAIIWQAMLMSAGLEPSKNIIINGFVNIGNQKMSKSLGNVVDPYTLVEQYSAEALRYYVVREMNSFEDSDYTDEKFKTAYNSGLANGIGNLASRILKMAEKNLEFPVAVGDEDTMPDEFKEKMQGYDLKHAYDFVWEKIAEADKQIQDTKPFMVVKDDKEEGQDLIEDLVLRLHDITVMLKPLLPESCATIEKAIRENKSLSEPLFPRVE